MVHQCPFDEKVGKVRGVFTTCLPSRPNRLPAIIMRLHCFMHHVSLCRLVRACLASSSLS